MSRTYIRTPTYTNIQPTNISPIIPFVPSQNTIPVTTIIPTTNYIPDCRPSCPSLKKITTTTTV